MAVPKSPQHFRFRRLDGLLRDRIEIRRNYLRLAILYRLSYLAIFDKLSVRIFVLIQYTLECIDGLSSHTVYSGLTQIYLVGGQIGVYAGVLLAPQFGNATRFGCSLLAVRTNRQCLGPIPNSHLIAL